jgi:hypothetical protein
VNRYVMAGEALRLLVSGEESLLGCDAASLRSVLRTGAEACEELDDMSRQLAQALQRNAELEALVSRAAEVLSREPLPIEGGSWAVFELARELRCSLDQAEQNANRTHQSALTSGRTDDHTAALMTNEQASLAYHLVARHRPAGEADEGAGS